MATDLTASNQPNFLVDVMAEITGEAATDLQAVHRFIRAFILEFVLYVGLATLRGFLAWDSTFAVPSFQIGLLQNTLNFFLWF